MSASGICSKWVSASTYTLLHFLANFLATVRTDCIQIESVLSIQQNFSFFASTAFLLQKKPKKNTKCEFGVVFGPNNLLRLFSHYYILCPTGPIEEEIFYDNLPLTRGIAAFMYLQRSYDHQSSYCQMSYDDHIIIQNKRPKDPT